MFTNINIYKQLRVTGGKKIWLGNLENTLIWQTARESGVISQEVAQGDGARTTRSG